METEIDKEEKFKGLLEGKFEVTETAKVSNGNEGVLARIFTFLLKAPLLHYRLAAFKTEILSLSSLKQTLQLCLKLFPLLV